jgi:LysR family transcriptional regulator, glycine cleavage system transcriptional activator
MPRLPSTQALRAFEAAARHRSFSRAAQELGVTHGAVSHRIRKLEEMAGAPLFEREGNGMVLTPAGNRHLHAVRQVLDLMGALFPQPARTGPQRLRISVLPSFASHWLIPRLHAFHAAHPDLLVELDARLDLTRIGPGHVDAAIRHGRGPWPGHRAEKLVDEAVFPVCAPAYRQAMGITGPADLARCRLLRHSFRPWKPWFTAAGLELAEPGEAASYDDAGLMLDAAIAGDGVVLTRRILAADALAKGHLVKLFPGDMPTGEGYFFVRTRQRSPLDPALDRLAQWLGERLGQEFGGA